MSAARLFAVFVIFVGATLAWVILAGSLEFRTNETRGEGAAAVGALWGEPQAQRAPEFWAGKRPVSIASSDITADLTLDQRRKGLLWYSTYSVGFSGAYGISNDTGSAADITMRLAFPTATGVYDGFAVSVDGKPVGVQYRDGFAVASFRMDEGQSSRVELGYTTQGLDEWRYVPTQGVSVIDDFSLVMRGDFDGYDFPPDGVSPTSKQERDGGWELVWDYDSLVSGRPIALSMPNPLDPGPVAARISLFAPVSLLFYFAALILVTATRGVNVHPMNFAFLAAGFFSFHLLFAYLVDRMTLEATFLVASLVSVGLCVSYLRLAVSDRRTLAEAAVGQLVFLVLFSFSFFIEGFTGLAITIGAVLTLAYFMFTTARIDWGALFERSAAERAERRWLMAQQRGIGQTPYPAPAQAPVSSGPAQAPSGPEPPA